MFLNTKQRISNFGRAALFGTALAIVAPSISSFAQEPSSPQNSQPDNTAQNARKGMTADKQTESAKDRETTKKIRQAIMTDKSLSTYAHNVKLITVNGTVTLKGPVRSEEEKSKIGSIAEEIAGSKDLVVNALTIKPEAAK